MIVDASPPQKPAAVPERLALPTAGPAPRRRTKLFAGAILLFAAAGLPSAAAGTTMNLAILRIRISGATAAFALTTVYPLEGAIFGIGLFLSMLGLETQHAARRSLKLGGATFALAGGIGGAIASLFVYYNLYFGGSYPYEAISGYNLLDTLFASLLWTGLGLFFLSYVVDA